MPTPHPSLHRFFAPKRFHGRLRLGGRVYGVEVRTPDLTDAEARMWADWGPMYACELGDREATVVYRSSSGDRAAYTITPSTIEIGTPREPALRSRFPFRMQIVDAARGLLVTADMDPDGDVQRVDIEPIAFGIDVHRLLFQADDRSRRTLSNTRLLKHELEFSNRISGAGSHLPWRSP